MKKILFSCIVILLCISSYAQQDLGFTYQAIARDASGKPIPDKANLQVRFSIRMGFDNGPEVFSETFNNVSTNAFGLFSLQIGSNNKLDFNQIEWADDIFFLNVVVDGQDLGTQQLLAVPYSKIATQMSLGHLSDVSISTPTAGQVLKWDGSQWVAGPDEGGSGGGNYSAGSGINISGANVISNTAPDQVVSITGNGGISVTGGYPSFIISSTGGETYTAGTGISINVSNVISNTGDTNPADDITIGTIAGGDLSGSYPNPTVAALRGRTVSPANPSVGDVFKWNGTQWRPEPDAGGVSYSAGSGINISGSVISNTGDINGADDITTSTTAGGDLKGSYPNPGVDGLQGYPVSPTTPQTGEVLKWTGSQWAPGVDNEGTSGSNIWAQNGNDIHYNTGKVGIGVANPASRLHVNATGQDEIFRAALSGNAKLVVNNNGGTSLGSATQPPNNGLYVSGFTGLGTNLPSEVLDVNGNTRIRGQFYIHPNSTGLNLVKLGTGTPGEGTIETLGPNGNKNALLSSNGSGGNYGFLGIYDNNGSLMAGIQVEDGISGNTSRGRVFGNLLSGEVVEADTLIATAYKSFRVQHPENPQKEIWYASVEGPEAAAYVRGTGKITNGKAVIEFPSHFRLLIDPNTLTIHLTPLHASSRGLAVVSKTAEHFEVCELLNGKGNYSFDWEAKAVRKGYENFEVVREKVPHPAQPKKNHQ